MKIYRVYGTDTSDYAFGGPLFDDKIFLKEVKANNPEAAKRKVYNWSKRKHLGWPLYSLTVRTKRKSK